MSESFKIQCLVPDLPSPQDTAPFLEEMHAARWYSNFGPLNKRFEQSLQGFIGGREGDTTNHVVTFTSATTALEGAMRALGLPEGARVLIPALTFPATATAIINAGFVPVLSDVCCDSWEMLPSHATAAMANGPIHAIMPVAVYGKPVDVLAWDAFSRATGLPVVVDAAAALGQQPCGELVHLAFSLHATKPFSVGEGGLLVTPDPTLAEKARSWSNFGFAGPGGVISHIGTNAKMGEYYAAVGLAQMNRWPEVVARRQAVLDFYRSALAPLDNLIKWQAASAPFLPGTFVVHTDGKAKATAGALAAAGIHSRFWYLPPLYEHPALKGLVEGLDLSACFPVIEELKHSLLGLPFHGFLTRDDVDQVSSVLAKIL